MLFIMKRKLLFLVLLLFLFVFGLSAQTIKDKLLQLKGISSVIECKYTQYPESYVMFFDHPLDYRHPSKGMFKQRVIVCHVGFDRPTVLVTEGYNIDYYMYPEYSEELAKILNANIIIVEYRYFSFSTPEPCNWKYLTVKNSMYDLHAVREAFKNIYPGKWIATGVSKGGQTAMFYRAFFPEDVDITVPYVAPLNRSVEDGRHEPFIANITGTTEGRKQVYDLQCELLKRKPQLINLFAEYCNKNNYSYRIALSDIYDYCVLEYSFSFWQFTDNPKFIPPIDCPDSVLFRHFITISEPYYFSQQTPFTSFNVQAARELGYYGYDTKQFNGLMSLESSKHYLSNVILPDSISNIKFNKQLYRRTVKFLIKEDPKMMFIYGGNDPWFASGVEWIQEYDKKNIKVFVKPGGDHSTRINDMPDTLRNQILTTLNEWLK